ncbi:hypothetical protein [Reinekea sp.]|jgi:hypothetical protein|uniref:hypothetical protein n=1 Tax=Reinekea sp. TaxID=1970455 RepID=UPI002A80CF4A|nr:hypothetical protein [Reinekea sp.]
MYKIQTLTLVVAATMALSACDPEAISETIAALAASDTLKEDIKPGDIGKMAKEDGGMKDFVTETNKVDPTVVTGVIADKLVLTDFLAKDIWRLVDRSLSGMNEVISGEPGPFSSCTLEEGQADHYTIDACSGVVKDKNGKDMTLNFEADVIWTEDENTLQNRTSGELYFGFERGDDFYVIGIQDLLWLEEPTETTWDERISGTVLYVSLDRGDFYEGYATLTTPVALSSPDDAGDREFNAGNVTLSDVDGNSFDLTYFGNMNDPSISIGM